MRGDPTLRSCQAIGPVGGDYTSVQDPAVVVTEGLGVLQRIAALARIEQCHHADVVDTIMPIGPDTAG